MAVSRISKSVSSRPVRSNAAPSAEKARGCSGGICPEYGYVGVAGAGGVTHVGWSADSSCVRSNCDGLELRYWDCDGVQLSPSEQPRLATLEWAASDAGALYARETRGVHVGADGEDMRVRALGFSHGATDRLLAAGDDFQRVRLLRLANDPSSKTKASSAGWCCL